MQRDTIVKILSILQRQKIPEELRIRLENRFSWNIKKLNLKKLKFVPRAKIL